MKVLTQGDQGSDVRCLQHRLIVHGASLSPFGADGKFGETTRQRVAEFQKSEGLVVDGVVGGVTWRALQEAPEKEDEPSSKLALPDFRPISGNAARAQVFGQFKYKPAPTRGNPEGISILDDWAQKNVVTIRVPQLKKIPGIMHQGRRVGAGPRQGTVSVHKKIADQFVMLWQAWEDEGFLDHVLTWAGLWNPRFIRGSRSVLSNHAWATAFDINAPWNGLGAEPAQRGARGSVRDLVPLASEHGFWWGGFWNRRKDGMHFEAAETR